MKTYQVVFYIDEPTQGRAEQVLSNIHNLLDDMGNNAIEVELLANGSGVRILTKDGDYVNQIRSLSARGVRFVACAHSLARLNLAHADLFQSVDGVPAGVSELVKKQAEGWSYIRP